MKGCLSLPFRLLALALLVLGAYVAWSYRREIKQRIHEWTAEEPPPASSRGSARPGPGGAREAIRRIESLAGAGTDSVVLSAGEVAGLVAGLAEALVPGAVDSLEIRLDEDDVEVRAMVDTRRVPLSLGPLAGVVKEREYVEAGGRLVYRRTGAAEWKVERVRVRGLPIPRELFSRVLERFAREARDGVIGFQIPREVSGLRVASNGVTLYGAGKGR